MATLTILIVTLFVIGYMCIALESFTRVNKAAIALLILLGIDYAVIEEGCNGRTTIHDDPIDGWKNGLDYLKPCLNSHKPIDIVIMMLGSNDLKENLLCMDVH